MKASEQFSGPVRAELTRRIMNTQNIGGGIPPYISDTDPKSGIYIPDWEGTPAPPGQTIRVKQYYFRMANGCQDMNVDFCWDIIYHSPNWIVILTEQANICGGQ